ncbi:class A beta-lactamase [Micromonospora arborensis]|uniref:class A beta-lactamase n=1 Tax=Micromonospora arborensis TaxID=2116518 RepID=UPI0033CBE61D
MAALLPLVACGEAREPGASSPAASSPPVSPSSSAEEQHSRLVELERRFDARLGVYALATGTGATIAHRADERFAFCSTFKGLAAAAILHNHSMPHLETVVRYSREDLMKSAVITGQHVATGMTIRQLADAAVRYSDGTAGNLLLRDLGGPAALTAYLRSLGDSVTQMDRIEPEIVSAIPGDPRDTTTPRAIGTDYQKIVLGDALPADKREFLKDLLTRNTTGARRIRAGLPTGWTVADKTGTGDYGTINDIAIVWPPGSAPLVISMMSSRAAREADYDQALLAEATAYVVDRLA